MTDAELKSGGLPPHRTTLSELIDRSKLSPLQWRMLLLSGLMVMIDGFDIQAIAFVAPAVAAAFGVSKAALAVVIGSGVVGLAIGTLVLGTAGDRFGRRRTAIFAFALAGVASVACSITGSIVQLSVLRLIVGIGLGGVIPNLIALTSEYAPRRMQTTLVTLIYSGLPAGSAIGGAIAGFLLPIYGWRGILLLGGLLPLFLLLFVRSLPETMSREAATESGRQRLLALARWLEPSIKQEQLQLADKHSVTATTANVKIATLFLPQYRRNTFALWGMFFGCFFIVYFLLSWLPTILSDQGKQIAAAIGSASIFNLGGVIGGITIARFVDKLGHKVLLLVFIVGLCTVAALGQASAALFLPTVFFAGCTVMGSLFCINGVAVRCYPTACSATGLGWALGMGRIGSITSVAAGGALLTMKLPFELLFIIVAMPCALCALCVAILSPQAQGQPDAPLLVH
ncbi:MAG: MFS transporter [Steroidobacteraceae bacterium]